MYEFMDQRSKYIIYYVQLISIMKIGWVRLGFFNEIYFYEKNNILCAYSINYENKLGLIWFG